MFSSRSRFSSASPVSAGSCRRCCCRRSSGSTLGSPRAIFSASRVSAFSFAACRFAARRTDRGSGYRTSVRGEQRDRGDRGQRRQRGRGERRRGGERPLGGGGRRTQVLVRGPPVEV